MHLRNGLLLLTFFTTSLGQSAPKLIECNAVDINQYTKEITITFIVPEKDFITCSISEPTTVLSPWHADKQSVAHYDSSFKDAKQIFNETFNMTMTKG